MNSHSSTDETASSETVDNRQVVDNGGIAVGAESVVTIHQVPDEAFELTGEVVGVLADIVAMETTQDQSDLTQVTETAIKYGVPAVLAIMLLKG